MGSSGSSSYTAPVYATPITDNIQRKFVKLDGVLVSQALPGHVLANRLLKIGPADHTAKCLGYTEQGVSYYDVNWITNGGIGSTTPMDISNKLNPRSTYGGNRGPSEFMSQPGFSERSPSTHNYNADIFDERNGPYGSYVDGSVHNRPSFLPFSVRSEESMRSGSDTFFEPMRLSATAHFRATLMGFGEASVACMFDYVYGHSQVSNDVTGRVMHHRPGLPMFKFIEHAKTKNWHYKGPTCPRNAMTRANCLNALFTINDLNLGKVGKFYQNCFYIDRYDLNHLQVSTLAGVRRVILPESNEIRYLTGLPITTARGYIRFGYLQEATNILSHDVDMQVFGNLGKPDQQISMMRPNNKLRYSNWYCYTGIGFDRSSMTTAVDDMDFSIRVVEEFHALEASGRPRVYDMAFSEYKITIPNNWAWGLDFSALIGIYSTWQNPDRNNVWSQFTNPFNNSAYDPVSGPYQPTYQFGYLRDRIADLHLQYRLLHDRTYTQGGGVASPEAQSWRYHEILSCCNIRRLEMPNKFHATTQYTNTKILYDPESPYSEASKGAVRLYGVGIEDHNSKNWTINVDAHGIQNFFEHTSNEISGDFEMMDATAGKVGHTPNRLTYPVINKRLNIGRTKVPGNALGVQIVELDSLNTSNLYKHPSGAIQATNMLQLEIDISILLARLNIPELSPIRSCWGTWQPLHCYGINMIQNYWSTVLVKYPVSTIEEIVIAESKALMFPVLDAKVSSKFSAISPINLIKSFDASKISESNYYEYVFFALKFIYQHYIHKSTEAGYVINYATELKAFLNSISYMQAPTIYGYGSLAFGESSSGSNFQRPSAIATQFAQARASLAMNLIVDIGNVAQNVVGNIIFDCLRHTFNPEQNPACVWTPL